MSANAAPIPGPVDNRKQLFAPFSWLPAEAQSRDTPFIELTRDIACGIAMTLDLINTSELEEKDCIPILGVNARSTMLLFAKASANLLSEHADHVIDQIRRRSHNADRKAKGVA
jgi:hypothetical protein